MQKITITEPILIQEFFAQNFPAVSFELWQIWCRKGEIKLNGKKISGNIQCNIGDILRLPPPNFFPQIQEHTPSIISHEAAWQALSPLIIFQNDQFMVINKPAKLAVQGGSAIELSVDLWLQTINQSRPKRQGLSLVHRLDKDTTGVLIIAKSHESASIITAKFKSRAVKKIYHALCVGRPSLNLSGTINDKIGLAVGKNALEKMAVNKDGDEAQTKWRVLATSDAHNCNYLELSPHSGRKHQLRVHLSHYGCPIIGDGKYGGKLAHSLLPNNKNMLLHAYEVHIPDIDGKIISIRAPLPEAFYQALIKFNLQAE